jgi:hypothetical protein
VHQFLGFVESFVANFWCRICKIHRDDARVLTRENSLLLRNETNYEEDLHKEVSECGINEESLLNTIPGYHVTNNSFVDAMHDVAEGVASFGMFCIVQHYLDKKVFSLEALNERIGHFVYLDLGNKPPPVTKAHMLKGDLTYSASEMINFVLYFGLMVGDLVPHDCEVWLYYITLRNLVDTILSKQLSKQHALYLRELVHEHHTLYKDLFKKHLRPKHHLLLHYPRCLLETGPFTHNWGMRFESKHTLIKVVSNVMKSRVNLCKSIATRHMFLLAHQILSTRNDKWGDISDVGPNVNGSNTSYCWVIRKGVKFSLGNIVCIGSNEDTLLPTFGVIEVISVNPDMIIKVRILSTLFLDIHMTAYVIEALSPPIVQHVLGDDASAPLITVNRNNTRYVANVGLLG